MANGRKVPVKAHDNAIVIFFIPVISFNLKLDIFILYINPIHKGKRTTKKAKRFFEKDKSNAIM